MLEKDVFDLINDYYYVSIKKWAELSNITEDGAKQRFRRKKKMPLYEAKAMVDRLNEENIKFDFNIIKNAFQQQQETVRIDYYYNNKMCLEHSSSFSCYFMDTEFLKNYQETSNKHCTAEDLKLIMAIDDKLDGGELWVRKGNVVLVDTSYNDVIDSAYYVYECNGGEYISAARIEKLMDGSYKFTYPNEKYQTQLRDEKFLNEVKFRLIGRIIKNLMFFA